eukprot:scaffold21870_cov47-Attheya_sp.AAC.5
MSASWSSSLLRATGAVLGFDVAGVLKGCARDVLECQRIQPIFHGWVVVDELLLDDGVCDCARGELVAVDEGGCRGVRDYTPLIGTNWDVDGGLVGGRAHVAHDNSLGVLAVIVDVSPRGHALEQLETIVRGEEPHATHAGVIDQFFALVGGAVDPLGDWVFLGIPGSWFLGTGDGASSDGLDFVDGLGKHDGFLSVENKGNKSTKYS